MSCIRLGINYGTKFGVRSVTYLHTGARVRGLKRDPSESLKNPYGLHFNSLLKDGHVATVRKALNLEKYGADLPDELLAQCLTHKSFAQGIKPYNQKLSIIGGHFIKFQACLYSVNQPVSDSQLQKVGAEFITSPEAAGIMVNGLNFGMLGKGESKMLISKQTMAEFIQRRGVDKLVFWNKRDLEKNHIYNGEFTVLQTVLNAVVGGIYLLKGQEKAAEYVTHELFNTNDNSLTKISEQLLSKSKSTEKNL